MSSQSPDPESVSSTALAKQLGLPSKAVFALLLSEDLVRKEQDQWVLTDAGQAKGGEYRESKQYGRYIVWPASLADDKIFGDQPSSLESEAALSSTAIGKEYGFSAQKVNAIISELGWIKKATKGWLVTPHGSKLGGHQMEHPRTGVPFVRWPRSILKNKSLVATIQEQQGVQSAAPTTGVENQQDDFRSKFPTEHRATDGHFVRSKAEMLIDNWLYMSGVVHAYERRLPIEEDQYCDFYIPTKKVYIEYWEYENNQKYLERKKTKIGIYESNGFNLIQLNDSDVKNLDDVMPRMLLKYDIRVD